MATQEIKVPNLDGAENVGIIELYVQVGDSVAEEAPIISLESDKAVMDLPSPFAGTITEMKVKEGDSVNSGDVVALIETEASSSKEAEKQSPTPPSPSLEASVPEKDQKADKREAKDSPPENNPTSSKAAAPPAPVQAQSQQSHATPSLRAFARELGADLSAIKGTGPKGRITRDDVLAYVKKRLSGSPTSSTEFRLPPIPSADFTAFGSTSTQELSRIKKISGAHLHRNWIGVPHITQFEETDITDLEAFRQKINSENAKKGLKLSPLIPIIKATIKSLQEFPDFNSSLSPDASALIHKKYYNIGIAVDTKEGLVVPVIKDADKKGLFELAQELADLSSRAREGKLKINEMKGASFTISSLGGIGGTYFSPIVNAPEVAILGLSRSSMKPLWDGENFVPRLILPFSVSYDHRVIDGAQGARFAVYLASVISDLRRSLV